jgi:hypothetical protein
MHWPKTATIERVDSPDAVLVLRSGATLRPDNFATEELAELLRAALVLGVSGLDRYIHERTIKQIVTALRSSELSRQQEDLSIPATLALRLGADLLKAHKAKKLRRPANEVRKALQDTLCKRPFQSWHDLEFAFSLIGIRDMASQVQSKNKLSSVKPLKAELNQIVRRRNQIVHEGDLVRHQRGGKPRRHPIDAAYVRRSMDFIDNLVLKLENVS